MNSTFSLCYYLIFYFREVDANVQYYLTFFDPLRLDEIWFAKAGNKNISVRDVLDNEVGWCL